MNEGVNFLTAIESRLQQLEGEIRALASQSTAAIRDQWRALGPPVYPPGLPGTDEVVKVDAADSTAGYLDGKLVAGDRISFAVSAGPDKTLTISADLQECADEKVKVDSGDSTAGYLDGKLVAGSGITLTPSAGPNKTLTVAAAAVAITLVKTWDGGTCRPKLRKGNVWYLDLDAVTLVDGVLTLPAVQMCLPMYDVPGYCPASGAVQMEDMANGGPAVTFLDGKVVDPVEGTPLFGTDPASGETVLMTVNADGTIDGHTGPITVLDPSGGSRLYRIEGGLLLGGD